MEIPRIALGTYALGDDEKINEPIRYAIEELGYRHLDCAEFYLNEKAVGTALKHVFDNGKVKREDIWVTSKIWNHHHRPEDVEKCCRQSLKDLQLDYLDLYLIHWPCTFADTPDNNPMPFDEATGKMKIDNNRSVLDMWPEMEKLVSSGLVKHIGVSNFSIELLERFRFDPRVKIQPYCNQVECNLYMQQEALRMYCEFRGMYLECYSPLGSGSWKQKGQPNLLGDPVLCEVANEIGRTPGAVELKFLLQLSPKIVILPKSSNPTRQKENICLDFTLNDDQMERLKKCERCYRYIHDARDWGVNVHGDDF